MKRGNLRWVVAVGVLILFGTMRMPLLGQHTGSPDALTALLVEVRGIRVAMEQMTSSGARVQLALGRLQLQEQRLNTMLRRLDAVREQKASAEREAVESREQLTRLEEAGAQTQDPDERQALAAQHLALVAMLEQGTRDVLRLASEETQLSSAVRAEQGRWTEINDRLEELERALGH